MMTSSQESHSAIVVDTNILMAIPAIHRLDWGAQPITVYILDAVVDELRGLARDKQDTAKAAAAQRALSVLDNLQKRTPPEGIPLLKNKGRLIFAKSPLDVPSPLDPTSVDHQQIALAQAHLTEGFCAIVTRDREMADIAVSASPAVPVVVPGGGAIELAIQRRLARMIHWWKLHREEGRDHRPYPVKPARLKPQACPDRRVKRLEQVICNLYGRLRSVRHRAILAVAPLEARLALTAHLIRILTRHKNRVIFLFVESQADAVHWAGELRQRCMLRPDAVLVFGEHGVPQVHGTCVVTYHHAQIERRFSQHAARFTDAGRRITALVDGCDLLDPVWIATLLLRCDQLIGFTRYPLDLHFESSSTSL